jgi:NAD(P)H-flavin reductase
LAGEVDPGPYQKSALSDEARARGEVLMCCACALSDVELEVQSGAALRDAPLPVYDAVVKRLEPLAHDVMLLELALESGVPIEYQAGQYINILLSDGARRSYSFTERSADAQTIALHIRLMPGGRFTTQVFTTMKVGDKLKLEGPLGEFVLREPSEKPLIFVAGATGFAPVKSLLEEAFHLGITRPLHFYWGVRRRRDLYMQDLVQQWVAAHPNFHFVPVLSDATEEDAWSGRTGFVHQAILDDFPNLAGCAVYACGSVKMVEVAKPAGPRRHALRRQPRDRGDGLPHPRRPLFRSPTDRLRLPRAQQRLGRSTHRRLKRRRVQNSATSEALKWRPAWV